jgi:uncharacterized protein YciI
VSQASAKATYVVEYLYVTDIAERRGAVRDTHRAYLDAGYGDGVLLFAGNRGETLSRAAADPVVSAGLVRAIQAHEVAVAYSRLTTPPTQPGA